MKSVKCTPKVKFVKLDACNGRHDFTDCPLPSSQMGKPRLCPTNLWRLAMPLPDCITRCPSLLHAFAIWPFLLHLWHLAFLSLYTAASCPLPTHHEQWVLETVFLVACLLWSLEVAAFTYTNLCCPLDWILQAFFTAASIPWIISKAFLRDRSTSINISVV